MLHRMGVAKTPPADTKMNQVRWSFGGCLEGIRRVFCGSLERPHFHQSRCIIITWDLAPFCKNAAHSEPMTFILL